MAVLADVDLVVIDATAETRDDQSKIVAIADGLRLRAPQLPVLLFSAVRGSEPRTPNKGCRMVTTADGSVHVDCRLHQVAWRETEALVRDALERDIGMAIEFEFHRSSS